MGTALSGLAPIPDHHAPTEQPSRRAPPPTAQDTPGRWRLDDVSITALGDDVVCGGAFDLLVFRTLDDR